jgi:5-methyltetrahydrofolate--homocysteine methyltransferase
MVPVLKEIYEAVLKGDAKTVESKVQTAIQEGIELKEILDLGMVSAMAEFYIPEMLISARAMQSGMVVLNPLLNEANNVTAGRVAVGTVKGDLHDIGKNLVSMMLNGAGFEIIDLGTDVDPEKFVAIADQVNVIALSALLTTTMLNMKVTIDALKQAGKRSGVKVIIGGAPVTETYAQQIGADGYAADASRAVAITKALIGKLP